MPKKLPTKASNALEAFTDDLVNTKDSFDSLARASYDSSEEFRALREKAKDATGQFRYFREAANDAAKANENLTNSSRNASEALEAQRKALAAIKKSSSNSSQALSGLQATIESASEPVGEYTKAMNDATAASDRLQTVEKAMNELRSQGVSIPTELLRENTEATYAANTAKQALVTAINNKTAAEKAESEATNAATRAMESKTAAAGRLQVATDKAAQAERERAQQQAEQEEAARSRAAAMDAAMSELNRRSKEMANADPFTKMAHNAREALDGLKNKVTRELIGGVQVMEKTTLNLGPAARKATQEYSNMTQVLHESARVQAESLARARSFGEIGKKRYEREMARLRNTKRSTEMLIQRTYERYMRELEGVETVFRKKQLAHATEMKQLRRKMEKVKEERDFEESFANMLTERMNAEKERMNLRIEQAKRAYDQEFRDLDRIEQKKKIAHDERMSNLNYELEKVRQISNERIAELEQLTPAEEKLAKLREKDLKARASDSSLSEREASRSPGRT